MKQLREKLQNIDLGWCLVFLLVCACCAAGGAVVQRHYDRRHLALQAEAPEPPRWEARHVHTWGKWGKVEWYGGELNSREIQSRYCTECGQVARQRVPAP